MARYCRFFEGLRSSPCREVTTLANLLARDIRSSTGSNIRLITDYSGKNPWVDSPASIRSGLKEAEVVDIQDVDKWRVRYLGVLLEQRMEWHYRGAEDEEKEVQRLIDSLCVN
jgi:hypothetical protein